MLIRNASLAAWMLLASCAAGCEKPEAAAPVAPANPFVGVWKVDPARSRQISDPIRYEDLGRGRMRYSSGSSAGYEFAVDGKEYPSGNKRTVAWKSLGPGQWQSVSSFDGTVREIARWTLSSNGQSLDVTADGALPNGMTYRHEKKYVREGAGTGLFGVWRNIETNTHEMADGYVLTEDGSGIVTWSIPTDNQIITGRFDGSDMQVAGATAPPGTTLAVRKTEPRIFDYVMKVKGSVIQYGRMMISDDGNTFVEDSWPPGREGQKSTTVLVRYRCPETDGGRPDVGDKRDPNWICGVAH